MLKFIKLTGKLGHLFALAFIRKNSMVTHFPQRGNAFEGRPFATGGMEKTPARIGRVVSRGGVLRSVELGITVLAGGRHHQDVLLDEILGLAVGGGLAHDKSAKNND